jgi:hypothetical protein
VTSFVTLPAESGQPSALSPPVHPRCARRLRSVRTVPCRKQWFIHIRSSRRSPSVHSHTCPIGLRCSCVPIHFDGHLIGVAKVVVGSETSDRAFSAATSVLKLIVSGICQDSLVSVLSEEVGSLRQCVAEFRQIQSKGAPVANSSDRPVATPDPGAAQRRNRTLVAWCPSANYSYSIAAEATVSVGRFGRGRPAGALGALHDPRPRSPVASDRIRHLTDLRGLRCRRLPRGRGYVPPRRVPQLLSRVTDRNLTGSSAATP